MLGFLIVKTVLIEALTADDRKQRDRRASRAGERIERIMEQILLEGAGKKKASCYLRPQSVVFYVILFK